MDKIKNPMDLQTIKENILKKKYHSRQDFLGDINQIVENSAIFNGEVDVFTQKVNCLRNIYLLNILSKFLAELFEPLLVKENVASDKLT